MVAKVIKIFKNGKNGTLPVVAHPEGTGWARKRVNESRMPGYLKRYRSLTKKPVRLKISSK
jgi:hypothetical protein